MPTVNFYATLRAIVGQKRVEPDLPEGSSVTTILDEMFQNYPALRKEILDAEGQLQRHVSLFINGRDIRYLNGLDTELKEGEVLDVFPPVAGGLAEEPVRGRCRH